VPPHSRVLVGLASQRMAMSDQMEQGSTVKVKWSGEWWEAEIVETRTIGDKVKAVKVRYSGSGGEADEEWVEVESGRIKALREESVSEGGVYSADELKVADDGIDDATWWKDAGKDDINTDSLLWGVLEDLQEGRIKAGGRLLEIGAGARSPILIDEIPFKRAAGAGLVLDFLQKNPLFGETAQFDYNAGDRLPYGDEEFDTVTIPLKIPYMLEPDAVLQEARRVVSDDGVVIVSWTSDCRKGKVVKGWLDRSEDEQVGFFSAPGRLALFPP
jgi:hypothetical protein